MGRNCKLNIELQNKICEWIQAGNYDYISARACGIGKTTFYLWLKKGQEQKTGKYRDFLNAITRAKGTFETEAIKEIGFKHKEWILERSRPERWGIRQSHRVEHTGKIDIEIFKKYLENKDTNDSE